MTVLVLPQLEKAEVLLSEQEAALMQQLAAIQAKRKGLQSVIDMFDGDGPAIAVDVAVLEETAAPTAALESGSAVEAEPKVSEVTLEAKPAKAKVSARKSPATKTTQAKTVKKPTQAKKANGRAAHWQRYVLDDYRQQALPEVVADFLEAKAKTSVKIADVMSAIFAADMPKTQFLKARNRISNILSAGARNGEWYRGRGGTYSASKKAVMAS